VGFSLPETPLSVLLFSLSQAEQMSRPALQGALLLAGRGLVRRRAHVTVIVAEVALATVLLAGAGDGLPRIQRSHILFWTELRRRTPIQIMKDFFISYNRADRSWAVWIAWHLEEAGYTTVLQDWDFPPGSNFTLEMDKAFSGAERTIAVLSPDYLTSSFAKPEWAAPIARDPTGEKRLLLPVRVRECEPKGFLSQIVRIDIFSESLSETAAADALLAGVNRDRGLRRADKPDFPSTGIVTARRTATQKPRFPGTLPPTCNITYRRNTDFTGRVQLLDSLRTALASGRPAALTQVMTGLGGVGKTQTAVEYAYRFGTEYEVGWWIRAEEPTKLLVDYAALASALKLPEKDASEQLDPEARPQAIVDAVQRWFRENSGWLLIFDNAQGLTDVRKFLPQASTGQVIVTSRTPNWQGMSVLPVEMMERNESVNFLLLRTTLADQEAASNLAEALGDLPLALEQAGAYIVATHCSIAEYLTLLDKHSSELMTRAPGTDYPESVATTWKVSFEQVKKESPAAEDLLSLCAFLAPDEIPLQVLISSKGSQHLPGALAKALKDPIAFNDVVASLRRYSLVKVREDRLLSVHRLVQAVRRDRLTEEDMKGWAKIAVLLLSEAFLFDSDDLRTWPACSTLLPHALAATDHARALEVANEAAGLLLTALGKYSVGRAEFADVKASFEHALEIDERIHGPVDPRVAKDATNLGFLLMNQGDELSGAKAYFERALKINQKAYDANGPEVAMSLNNLGIILKHLGRLKQARKAFARALGINERKYGPEHPKVAVNLSNLGFLLKDQGDMKGAQICFERALKINEAAAGADLSVVATNLNDLGLILKDQGDTERAQTYFKRALAISEESYGRNHPEVTAALKNLGYLMRDKGNVERARGYLMRALIIYENEYGKRHPNALSIRESLGSLKKSKVISKTHTSKAP
jgi:tetratricopeptide (TPR) repeat protein